MFPEHHIPAVQTPSIDDKFVTQLVKKSRTCYATRMLSVYVPSSGMWLHFLCFKDENSWEEQSRQRGDWWLTFLPQPCVVQPVKIDTRSLQDTRFTIYPYYMACHDNSIIEQGNFICERKQ